MTAIIEREQIGAAYTGHGTAAGIENRARTSPARRSVARARGLSPRLSDSRVSGVAGHSIAVSNTTDSIIVRTDRGAVRVVGARGSAHRAVERPRVRSIVRLPRGASRVGGCARRSPKPTIAFCALLGVGVFTALVMLFSGATDSASMPVASQHAALTSVVTIRDGQSLEQVAREIAPGHPTAAVVAEIVSINGLSSERVEPGQTLVTPRY